MSTTLKTISAALKLIDVKKENLRKAFEDVQSHSHSHSSFSFSLSWSDLDSHFSSIQSELTHKFNLLQSQTFISHPITSNSNTQLADSTSGSKSLKKPNLSSPGSQTLTPCSSKSNAQVTNSKPESESTTQVTNSNPESKSNPKVTSSKPESKSNTQVINSKPESKSNTQVINSKPESKSNTQFTNSNLESKSNTQATNSKSESKSNTKFTNSKSESKSNTKVTNPIISCQESQTPTSSKANAQVPNSKSESRIARPELRSYCERMDGKGLRKFLMDRPKEHEFIRFEIEDALKQAPDAAKLVLEAVEEGFSKQSYSHATGNASRKNCIIMLEGLAGVVKGGGIDGEIKEKAKKFAMEWKGNMRSSKNREDERTLESLGILHLLNSFGLVSCFNVEEVVDLLVLAARYRCAPDFCRELGLVDRVPDIVQKLISAGKLLVAVKLVFEFKLTDKFPPVPLLKSHVDEVKKAANEIRKNGNHSLQAHNEATAKEVGALKSVLKKIEDHNLESEYPKAPIEMQIEAITTRKRDKKRPALAKSSPHQPKIQTHSQHQGQNKRSRIIKSAPVMYSSAPTFQEHSSHQTTRLVPGQHDPYLVHGQPEFQQHSSHQISAASVMYSTAPTLHQTSSHQTTSLVPSQPNPYSGLSAWPASGMYGIAEASPLCPSPSRSHLYSSESQLQPPAYYTVRSSGYGGYGLPPQGQYQPSYYHPQ